MTISGFTIALFLTSQLGISERINGAITDRSADFPHLLLKDSGHLANKFLIKISETEMDLPNTGLSTSDCIVVFPSRHFHLEHRQQQVRTGSDTVRVFDADLNETQLQQLKSVLQDEKVRNLPAYRNPSFPFHVSQFHYFTATIAKREGSPTVGFFSWNEAVPDSVSPVSASESTKKAWLDSEKVLKPLVEWFHSVEAQSLQLSNSKATQCNIVHRYLE